MASTPRTPAVKWLAAVLVFTLVGIALWMVRYQPSGKGAALAAARSTPTASSASTALTGSPSPDALPSGASAPSQPPAAPPSFQMRPLAVARESKNYQWTTEDGRSPDVIHKLAHNELEEQRMLAENPRIKARQLVYIKQTVADLMEQSKLTGQKADNLVLPGLNGQEFQFVITNSELNPSGQIGSFSGHLASDPNTTVTLAYKFGREAFTIVTPGEGTDSIEAEPREPGQVIVKSMDPSDYRPLHDHMILTTGPKGGYAPLPDDKQMAMPGMSMPGMNMPAATPTGH